MGSEAKKLVTPEEYLTLERAGETKHHYFNGEIVAMAGASLNHNRIVAELLVSIGSFLRKNKGCEVLPSDMRLHIPVNGLYTYPDVMVICGKPEFTDDKQDTITNPALVIEVISPSTEDYDRGAKFMRYRSIPSMQEYVMIDSTTVLVERLSTHQSGDWVLRESRDINGTLELRSINLQIPIAEIYARTEGF